MTMKITRLRSHWGPDEAWTVIEFLDGLRQALWEDYGDAITQALQHEAMTQGDQDTDQYEFEFDEDPPF